jgi:hypothetical protein
VPISIPFGHTSPDASRSSTHTGIEEPVRPRRLGRARVRAGVRLPHLCRRCRTRTHRLADVARGNADLTRPACAHRLCRAHGAPHAHRDARVAGVHLHLRDACGEKPACRDRAGAPPRHITVAAHSRLFHHYCLLSVAVAREGGRCGNGLYFPDFHQPGLEYGLQLLSFAAQHPARAGRGGPQFPPESVDALLASGSAVRHAAAHLEHDDVHVGRLVLRGCRRGHRSGQHQGHASRRRLLCGPGDRAAQPRCHRLGDRRHVRGHSDF